MPAAQRGLVAGVLGVCLPIASVSGTFLVQLFTGNQLAMFLVPCAIGGFFILLFAVTLNDRRLAEADKPTWSLREFASTFYVNPRKSPDFAWAFASRFMFVLAYAFLTTYQAYYLLDKIGSAEADVPHQIFLGTLVQSVVVVAASLIGGRFSDRTGRRKIFVFTASIVYGLAMFVIAIATDFNGFLVGMAIGGLGFGMYMAVDLALVADVLPDRGQGRQGSRCAEHRRRAPLLHRAGDRAGHPRDRRRQLRRAVRGRRGLRRARGRRHPAREGRPMRTHGEGGGPPVHGGPLRDLRCAPVPAAAPAGAGSQATGREGYVAPAGTMPVVIGEGLKPLTTIQTPSDSSQTKIGAAAMPCHTVPSP